MSAVTRGLRSPFRARVGTGVAVLLFAIIIGFGRDFPFLLTTGPFAEIELSIPSMVCDGCAGKIHQTLSAIPGVRAVKPKLQRKRVQVHYEPSKIQVSQIKDALGAAWFSAVEVQRCTIA